jgi:streptogramin lyase
VLNRLLVLGLALIASQLFTCAAVAATVQITGDGAADTYQVIPRPDGPPYYSGMAWNRSILLPDGSSVSNSPTADTPLWYSANGTGQSYPALPSGQIPSHFALGADGRVWFTEGNAADNSGSALHDPTVGRIGRFDPATGAVVEFGGLTTGANAQAIAPGSDGNVWFLEFGTNSVGRITPAGAVTEFPLPPGVVLARQRGEELTTGPGGDLYFVTAGAIGRMTTAGTYVGSISGGLTDFAPDAVAYAGDGNLWVSECRGDTLARISPSGTVTRMPEGTFPKNACPMGIVAAQDGTPWLYEWNPGLIARVVFDTPLARTDDATAVRSAAADLNGSASPRGVATTAHFEYGSTTGYGHRTPDQPIGDGDDPVDVVAHVTDLQPSKAYHFRLVATSVVGTVRGADQTVTTAAPPPPPLPPLPVDRDGDGFAEAVDCDDLSAAIHPGAADRPQDGIDQDCSGVDAPFERFQPHASAGWRRVHGRIVFTRLTIDSMPAGSALKLTCRGKGCGPKSYAATIAKPVQQLDISPRLKHARLGKGATVELTLSRPGYITTIVRWAIGKSPRVSVLCQAPGARKPSAC